MQRSPIQEWISPDSLLEYWCWGPYNHFLKWFQLCSSLRVLPDPVPFYMEFWDRSLLTLKPCQSSGTVISWSSFIWNWFPLISLWHFLIWFYFLLVSSPGKTIYFVFCVSFPCYSTPPSPCKPLFFFIHILKPISNTIPAHSLFFHHRYSLLTSFTLMYPCVCECFSSSFDCFLHLEILLQCLLLESCYALPSRT